MSLAENDGEDLSLEGHLERFFGNRQEELHTALPGRVVRYDAGAQTADVDPMIRRALEATDGTTVRESMPTIRAVPVVHPRWGDWFVHAPLAAGDFVLLICCERDLARWRTTGERSDPIDRRHHHLAHAVAIPGLYPRTRQLSDTPTDAMVIGREGGATVRIRDDGQVHVSGAEQLARFAQLGAHLNAIATGLDALMNLLSPGTPQPNYGVAAKAALDASQPIPTTNTRGS